MRRSYSKCSIKENQDNFTFNWITLWENRKKKSMVVIDAYRNSENVVLSRKAGLMELCGRSLVFETCETLLDGHTKRLKEGKFCADRLCPICNKRRAMQVLSALLLILEQGKYCENYKVVFMTLTIRNVAKLDKEVYKRLMKCWQRFQEFFLLGRKHKNRDNKYYYDGLCIGGVMTIETTFNSKQKDGLVWHPHIHGLLICKDYLDQKAASKYWEKITGDSKIVGFSKVKVHEEMGVIKGIVETVKYLAKLNDDMPAERIVELALALRRVRCMNGFGVLKGFLGKAKKLRQELGEKSLVCRKCGGNLIDLALHWFVDRYVTQKLKSDVELSNSCCNVHGI